MATLTLTVPDAQVTRVVNAVYANANNGALPATQAVGVQFLRQHIYEIIKGEVKGYEAAAAARAVTDSTTDPLDTVTQ